jgi:hypothetical protein
MNEERKKEEEEGGLFNSKNVVEVELHLALLSHY